MGVNDVATLAQCIPTGVQSLQIKGELQLSTPKAPQSIRVFELSNASFDDIAKHDGILEHPEIHELPVNVTKKTDKVIVATQAPRNSEADQRKQEKKPDDNDKQPTGPGKGPPDDYDPPRREQDKDGDSDEVDSRVRMDSRNGFPFIKVERSGRSQDIPPRIDFLLREMSVKKGPISARAIKFAINVLPTDSNVPHVYEMVLSK
ncbi:hypothetical protein F5Y18DRAFT_276263 [Xylariaceae sp. FL1019]|nr:hypothetical protein F5Y18DRAFT_276263 [Xylariaceae sp. FL1019]